MRAAEGKRDVEARQAWQLPAGPGRLDTGAAAGLSSAAAPVVREPRIRVKEGPAMRLVAPDILAELRGLSAVLCGVGVGLGLLLWVLGWRAHRFWIVLATTVIAGVFGLFSLRTPGVQPMVVGLLLAITAGTLALPLARVLAFVAGGVAGWVLVRSVAPAWEEPLISFFAGGLTGVLLFRFWMMTLTSLAGALVMSYAGLCLADRLGKVDAVSLAEKSSALLNWVCVGFGLLGLVVQYLVERWHARLTGKGKGKGKAGKPGEKKARPAAPPPAPPPPPPEEEPKPKTVWDWVPFRKAG
jgi:hypothetical protein